MRPERGKGQRPGAARSTALLEIGPSLGAEAPGRSGRVVGVGLAGWRVVLRTVALPVG